MIKVYKPAETGVILLNGSLDLGRCKVYPEKVEVIKVHEGTRVWFEIPVDTDDEEYAMAKASQEFYEYCALLSFFTRYPFSEKRYYGFAYSHGGSSSTVKPSNLIERRCPTIKIRRPWTDEYSIDSGYIPIPEDTRTLFDTYYKLDDDRRRRFLKIIFCDWFGRLTQDRFPVPSIAAFAACLDEASEYGFLILNKKREKKYHKASAKKFLKTHCSVNNWNATFDGGWDTRNDFIHGAELGLEEYTLQDHHTRIYRIKRRIQSPPEPYKFLVRAFEPIVNSSIIDWLIRTQSD